MPRQSKYPNIEDMMRKYRVRAAVDIHNVPWLVIPDSEIRDGLAISLAKKIIESFIPNDMEKIVQPPNPESIHKKTIYLVEYYIVRPEDIQEIVINELGRYRELNPPTYIDSNKEPII